MTDATQARLPRRNRGLLSAADASNIEIDTPDQVNTFLLAGTLGVGGFVGRDGGVDVARLRAALSERLTGPFLDLARFSQRIEADGRHLSWVPSEPDMATHVRVLQPVDGPEGLEALCATLMTVPLPRDRPLWEFLVVPGATADGPGIVLRVHHAVADGVAGVRLVQRLFGADLPAPPPPGLTSEPRQAGRGPRRRPLPGDVRRAARSVATSVSRVAAVFRATVPPTVLLGRIGARRGVAFTDVDLASLARSARQEGATVNDALLAAVSAAVAATLLADNQPVPPVLPASVPVALPDRGSSGNAVGVMLVPLPTGEADAGVRLARIAALTRSAKAEARAQGTYELTRTRWGSRLFAWLARRQRFVALFVTNVRGPDRPLLVAGAPLVRAWPLAPIQGNVRLGVAAMSYAGRLSVAVHTDVDAIDAAGLRSALARELATLAKRP